MKGIDLISRAKNTWCPGCGNFAVQHTLKDLLAQMDVEGLPLEKVVLVAGIGQHGKLFDFMNLNGFYSLHGRTIPVATGIKLANPDLKVICVTGDGDSYAEGLDHLIFAAKRNLDITVLVHDNRVYGLTTGQFTPTSPYGYRGHSTPKGDKEVPLNPMEAGARLRREFHRERIYRAAGRAQTADPRGPSAPGLRVRRYSPDLFNVQRPDGVLQRTGLYLVGRGRG